MVNPGRQNAPIRRGYFDAATGAVRLEGEQARPDGTTIAFRIEGRVDGRTLRLTYRFGDGQGSADLVRVEEYRPPRRTLLDRLKPRIAALIARVGEAGFWLFAALGAVTASGKSGKVPGCLAPRRGDGAVALLAVLLVRLMVRGIPFNP